MGNTGVEESFNSSSSSKPALVKLLTEMGENEEKKEAEEEE